MLFLLLAVAAAAVDVPWPLTQLPVTRGGASKATTVVLTDFGGIADGKTDNNGAFMQAFAHLAASGGGTLVVPHSNRTAAESVYSSTNILFGNMSSITLRLEAHVRVKALTDGVLDGKWGAVAPWGNGIDGTALQYAPVLHAYNVTDFVIEGTGVIDGDGYWWYTNAGSKSNPGSNKLKYQRPRLVVIEACNRVRLSNFTVANSPYWTLVLYLTEDVHISGVVVRNPSGGKGSCAGGAFPEGECFGPNADGIDVVSSQRVLVEDTDIVAGDDCICVKSGTWTNTL